MGRPLGGKTLLKKYRLQELELSELNDKELILLIEGQEKELFELKEDVRYTVNQKNKSQYKMASEMSINLNKENGSSALSPVGALMEIFTTLMGYEDEGGDGVDIKRVNYRFIYEK